MIKNKDRPVSFKLFATMLLCLIGLSYLTILGSIWIDTEMKIVNIIDGYGSFEVIELLEHSSRFLSLFIVIFSITIYLFLNTEYSEKVKKLFSVIIPVFIISDIGSMWLIGHASIFATILAFSGTLLASAFLTMFFLIQYDLWMRQDK